MNVSAEKLFETIGRQVITIEYLTNQVVTLQADLAASRSQNLPEKIAERLEATEANGQPIEN